MFSCETRNNCERSELKYQSRQRQQTLARTVDPNRVIGPRAGVPCGGQYVPSIRGPISSESWNAKTTSAQPSRASVLCELASRLIRHPIRNSAAKTRRALAAGH